MPDELVTLPQSDPFLALIDKALEKGMQPTELYALAKDNWKHRAQIAFNQALNAVQGEMTTVIEDKDNTHTQSKYATLEAVQAMAKPVYTRHGFSLSWSEGDIQANGMRRIIMTVRHSGGHVETHFGNYPVDGVGAKGGQVMNPLQGTVSSNTYAQRDMMRQFFSIVMAGQDFDGNSGFEGITDMQAEELNGYLERVHRNAENAKWPEAKWEIWKKDFWAYCKCTSMNDLTLRMFPTAVDRIKKVLKGEK